MFTDLIEVSCLTVKFQHLSTADARICVLKGCVIPFLWYVPKIRKIKNLKSGLNGGQNWFWFLVHVNMSVSCIILILVAN
jgi:hypothetical protein